MWINGLKVLQNPILHLHTQYNPDLRGARSDMDSVNLNQSAMAPRSMAFIWGPACALSVRSGRPLQGKRSDQDACGGGMGPRGAAWPDSPGRYKSHVWGINSAEVAGTEGDKVEAARSTRLSVNT